MSFFYLEYPIQYCNPTNLSKNRLISDERQLERLFIRCKNSVERAKDVLDMYYTLRTVLPEIFSDRDPAQDWFSKITSVR